MNPTYRTVWLLGAVGCGPTPTRPTPARTAAVQIAGIVADPARSSFTLSEIDDVPPWTALHVFAPYTDAATLRSQLGFRWADASRFHIENRDDIHLAVFVSGTNVVRVEEWERRAFDGDPALGRRPWTPRDVLRIIRGKGVPKLTPTESNTPAAGTLPEGR